MKKSGLKDFLVGCLCPYGSIRQVIWGPCRGMKIRVTPEIGASFLIGRGFDWQIFLRSKLKMGNTVYDVGAHCGESALFFAQAVGPSGRVFSFEPLAFNFQQLQANLKLNDLKQVVPVQTALSDVSGEQDFSFNPDCSFQGKLSTAEPSYLNHAVQKTKVKSGRLDDFLDTYPRPDLIKVDIEGGAAGFFRGAMKTLQLHQPNLYIELHGPEEQAAVQALMSLYDIYDLHGKRVTDIISNWASPVWGEAKK